MKDQLYRICGSEFYEWFFGPEKFSGLSRNGPQLDTLKKVSVCTVFQDSVEYMSLLHIMCGYQCDKAVNKNDTREVI